MPARPQRGSANGERIRTTGYPSMPQAHRPHRPRALTWVWVVALAIFCAVVVAAVWIIGPASFFPSDPAESPSASTAP
jgi:hypothetical protein